MRYNVRMNTSLSIFARALASENLTFAFDPNAQTASFDVKARHLVMPMWDVSDTLRTMLVAHEISHALWTPYEVSNRLFDQAIAEGYNEKLLHHICNMIEDVRIEKLMKVKYPGTRRDFFLGYREIIDKNLFNLSSLDWEKVDMVSRLNGHFKWGVPGFLTIPLTNEEFAIAAEVDAVETFEDAFNLAKRLYGHPSMEKARERFEREAQTIANGKGKDKDGDGDVEEGDGGTALTNIGGAFARKDGETVTIDNLTISPLADLGKAIFTTDMMRTKYERIYNQYGRNIDLDAYRKYVKESDAFVRQLVAQFERRKAADEIRRERPKQTGMLNLDRLHQYRTHDDIFLSKIIKQDGKNHGIMFLIDFSGSMGSTIGNCIHQVLQLVWFCEKAKIPFEVYGFTNLGHWGLEAQIEEERKAYMEANPSDTWGNGFRSPTANLVAVNPKSKSIHYGDARLINLASSRDSAADRERLLACLWEQYCAGTGVSCIPFGGTPTVESVAIVSQVMKKWVEANNIQIPTLMIVTDGQPGGIYTEDRSCTNSFLNTNTSLCVTNEIFGTVHYSDGSDNEIDIPNAIIGTMLDSLRTGLNARCIGMYVDHSRKLSENMFRSMCVTRKEYRERLHTRDSVNGYAYDSLGDSPRYEACAEQYESGALILPKSTYPGYDAFFLIRSMKAVSDEDAIVEKGSFVKVKNTFVKTMGKRSSSRVFLSKYVDIVAGQPLRDEDEKIYRLPFGLTWEEYQKKKYKR